MGPSAILLLSSLLWMLHCGVGKGSKKPRSTAKRLAQKAPTARGPSRGEMGMSLFVVFLGSKEEMPKAKRDFTIDDRPSQRVKGRGQSGGELGPDFWGSMGVVINPDLNAMSESTEHVKTTTLKEGTDKSSEKSEPTKPKRKARAKFTHHRAEKEIKEQQGSSDFCIKKKPFARAVKDVMRDLDASSFRITAEGLTGLQTAAEAVAVELLSAYQHMAAQGKRATVTTGDVLMSQQMAEDRTLQALRPQWDKAAREEYPEDGSARDRENWKKKAARHFFLFLPAELQDEVTPAASALRSGMMDAQAAAVLGVLWKPPPADAAAASSSFRTAPSGTRAELTPGQRRKIASEMTERLLGIAADRQEAMLILSATQQQLASAHEEANETLVHCSVCARLAPALNTFRTKLTGPALHQFDESVSVAISKNRLEVARWGLCVSRAKWKSAKNKNQQGASAKSKRGRPAKVASPTLVKQVSDCITKSSQASSVWLKSQGCHARTMTCSVLQAYWNSGLVRVLSWSTFRRIVRLHCKWAKKPSRKTDYCDYCYLFTSSIIPGAEAALKRSRAALEHVLPAYFRDFEEPCEGGLIVHLEAYLRHINQHAEQHPGLRNEEVRGAQRQQLHALEARIERRIRWEIEAAKSYEWHWLTAKRQSRALQKDLESLTSAQVLLWSDYKQNLSVPLAHTQLGDMFYGTSRMELTCWGCLAFEKKDGKVTTKHFIVLSSVIEHSALVSNLLYGEVLRHLDLREVQEVLAWTDCGPHFKCYEHVAGWLGAVVESDVPKRVRLCFHGEKPGKGQVDGLFGQIEGWVSNFLATPDRRIADIDEMEQVLKSAAEAATSLEAGVEYIVFRWEPQHKPEKVWTLPRPEFQISKTYCLLLRPSNPRLRIRNTSLVDYTFADNMEQEGKTSYPKVEEETLEDREWRRGYFSNTRWDRKRPAEDKPDGLMLRYREHQQRGVSAPNLEDAFAYQARKQAQLLLRRREK
ncbi:unnamed protein product [Effrenium voratum]|nr:unnamed protein product [Effrenium voratum]